MKIFYAQLSDGSTVKRKADRIEIVNESLRVWVGSELVAYLDLGAVLYAHIYEGRPTDGTHELLHQGGKKDGQT